MSIRTAILEDFHFSIPAYATTHEGFRKWAMSDGFPKRGNVTFIDGDIFIDMSPEEIITHNQVRVALIVALGCISRQENQGLPLTRGAFYSNIAACISTEPDFMFIRWKTLESGKAMITQGMGKPGTLMEIIGAPDVVVEVVGDSSAEKDTKRLRNSYHKAGVLEYWLIDCRRDRVKFSILQHKPDGYESSLTSDNWQRSGVFGKDFFLERTLGPMDFWQWNLLSRETGSSN